MTVAPTMRLTFARLTLIAGCCCALTAEAEKAGQWPIPQQDPAPLDSPPFWPASSDFQAIQPWLERLRSTHFRDRLFAENINRWCPALGTNAQSKPAPQTPAAASPSLPVKEQMYIIADQVTSGGDNSNSWQLRGAVEMVQDALAVRADEIDIDNGNGNGNGTPQRIDLRGHIRYLTTDSGAIPGFSATINPHSDLGFEAEQGYLLPETDQGQFDNTRYLLPKRRAHGTSSHIDLLDADRNHYQNLTYSTCPVPKDSWQVTSSEMNTDQDSGRAEIWNAVVRIKDVPVFYTPYANFPIDDRRLSGFLLPSFGSSKLGGFEFSTPFYLSLAPNYDALITPTVISERGLHAAAELRYLFPGHSGDISTGLLFNDQIRNDDRYLVKWNDSSQWSNGWSTTLQYSDISDQEYLNDFTTNLAEVSTSTLHRYLEASRNLGNWRINARVDDYKTIDPSLLPIDAPYQVLPRISATRSFYYADSGNYLNLEAEVANFRNNAKANGSRWKIRPELHFPSRQSWYETDTVISLDAATYSLNDTSTGGFDSNPTRLIPSFSSKGKLIFESDSPVAGYSQTLEPTVMYLYTPEVNQTRTPNFDSGSFERNYDNLFRRNRFTGGDRVGDENRLTLGLTTRLLDELGDQRLRADIGQSFFFEDRGVQLPGVAPVNNRHSELAAQVSANLTNNTEFASALVYDPVLDDIAQATVDFSYQGANDNLFKLRHRFVDNDTNLTEFAGRWRISPRWQFVGRMGYSHRLNQRVETLFGLEYQSCCWAFRVVNRSVQSGIAGQLNESILFEFELKGLTNVGNSISTLLESRIDNF